MQDGHTRTSIHCIHTHLYMRTYFEMQVCHRAIRMTWYRTVNAHSPISIFSTHCSNAAPLLTVSVNGYRFTTTTSMARMLCVFISDSCYTCVARGVENERHAHTQLHRHRHLCTRHQRCTCIGTRMHISPCLASQYLLISTYTQECAMDEWM